MQDFIKIKKEDTRPCQITYDGEKWKNAFFHMWLKRKTIHIYEPEVILEAVVELPNGYITIINHSHIRFIDAIKESEENAAKKNEENIKIIYHSDEIDKLDYIDGKSDWIDLRSAEDVKMKSGEYLLISLGVSMELPERYEAIVAPRSSTLKHFGILQTNGIGVIEESYCGDNDIWHFPALAVRDTEIHKNDRICQFRIQRHQPEIRFKEMESLGNKDRGGIGSTGKN